MKSSILFGATLAALLPIQAYAGPAQSIMSPMTVSAGAAKCLPKAQATVIVHSVGTKEELEIVASGLPANTDFDVFNIQVPNAPFGESWYLGDIESDVDGNAVNTYVGRFQKETFIISPGVAPAPKFPAGKFPDATASVTIGGIQIYHLGIWFNAPADASKAGCANTETPFNGSHNAGIQVLNTATFPDTAGPLSTFQP